jgi:hypothetical protein
MTASDLFTSTVDAAAAFERDHPDPYWEPPDDRPDQADLQRQAAEDRAAWAKAWADPWAVGT